MHISVLLLSIIFFVGSISSLHAESRGVHRVTLHATTENGIKLPLYNESHALLIGVSEYIRWPRLDSIPGELDQVEQALIEQKFNVERLNNPKGRELSDGIEDFIDKYGYEKENRLLIFFSGHGYSVSKKGFLIPADTPLPGDQGFRQKTVPMSRVMSWARDMEAKHALFVFDSCFSGSVFQSRSLPEDKERFIRQATAKPVRQFITAGSANQEVPAVSTFTPALVSAINGDGDLNDDGYITGSELGVHLSQLVPRFVDQTPQYGKIKDYDLAQGDFVFFKKEAQQTPQVASVSDQSLDALFWQSAERGDTVEEYQAYVDRYPNGTFTRLAQTRIDRLIQSQVLVEEEQPTLPVVATTGSLTIRVDPPDARVRIMNIVPGYRDGIELELSKSYDVLVTREGYESVRRQVRLTQQSQTETIALESQVFLDSEMKINEIDLPSGAEGVPQSVRSVESYPPPDQNVTGTSFRLHEECISGNPESCIRLGLRYKDGNGGVKKDTSRAAALYKQACDLGKTFACYNLGSLYASGDGVTMDANRATALYKKSCDGGSWYGCELLKSISR